MVIDDFIEIKDKKKVIGSGACKKCYDFEDFVLLETGYFSDEQLRKKIDDLNYAKDILDKINVNCFKIFDYKILDSKIYILESKVNGDALQRVDGNYCSFVDGEPLENGFSKSYLDAYLRRLYQLNNKKILKKFVLDFFEIINNGLYVDASRPSNFLFDEKIGVSFIDVTRLSGDYDVNYIFFYIIYNITYFKFYMINDISNDDVVNISFCIIDIYYKLIEIYKELGYGKEMYSLASSGTVNEYILKKINLFVSNVNDDNMILGKGL